jgi:hypothetical protein
LILANSCNRESQTHNSKTHIAKSLLKELDITANYSREVQSPNHTIQTALTKSISSEKSRNLKAERRIRHNTSQMSLATIG